MALPARMSTREGCQRSVTVTTKAGRRTVSRRRVALHGRCGYVVRLRFAHAPAGRLSVGARFGGDAVMRPRASHRRALRLH